MMDRGVCATQGFTDAMRVFRAEIREERISWIDTQELRDQLSYSPYILRRLQTCSACVCLQR